MKPIIALMMSLTLLVATFAPIRAVPEGNIPSTKGSIQLLSSPELLNMASTLVNEYIKANPEAEITVSPLPDNELKDQLYHAGTIGLLTKKYFSGISSENPWKLTVGRDVLVPVMNPDNPYRDEILQRGISPEAFSVMYTDSDNPSYYCDSKSSISFLAEFLEADQLQMNRNATMELNEMLDQIRNDKMAIGFCALADILDEESLEIESGIILIPIDMNGNGRIDHFEDIYQNSADLLRGIWLGKYPSALYSRLYMVAGARPTSKEELAFLEWMVTEGQQYMSANGFTGLNHSEKYSSIEHLKDPGLVIAEVPARATTAKVFLVVFGVLLAGVVILILIIRMSRDRVEGTGKPGFRRGPVFGESSVTFPGGLFFDKSHTWIFMEKDGNVRIGIDDFLQHVTGPITRISMKKSGERVIKGEPFLTLIQEGKHLEIQSPLTGIVREKNNGLIIESGIINTSPFSDGWVYLVEPGNWLKEIQSFLMGDKYRNWLNTEFSRLKDFFTSVTNTLGMVDPLPVLQDGGEIRDGILENFGPEVWEEFQTGFINLSR